MQFAVTETAAALAVEAADIEGRLEKLARTGHFLRSLGITIGPTEAWPISTNLPMPCIKM